MFFVVDPAVVNTVSNNTESCENEILAPGSVINVSFLQEELSQTKPIANNAMNTNFFTHSNLSIITLNQQV